MKDECVKELGTSFQVMWYMGNMSMNISQADGMSREDIKDIPDNIQGILWHGRYDKELLNEVKEKARKIAEIIEAGPLPADDDHMPNRYYPGLNKQIQLLQDAVHKSVFRKIDACIERESHSVY